MANLVIKVGGTALPGEVTALKRSDELLWSEGTGRSATTGAMSGSVVAKKQTWSIEWGVVRKVDYDAIRSAIGGGFKKLEITVGSSQLADCTVYRGTIAGDMLGIFGGVAYYKGVSVELVEQ